MAFLDPLVNDASHSLLFNAVKYLINWGVDSVTYVMMSRCNED